MPTTTDENPRPRVILHLDMDAFYAAVEVRDNPTLAGKPLIIGHRGARGVVSTCSYEARRFGIHSAMPSVTAERLCPQAVWLPGRMAVYVDVSHRIREIFDDFSPLVEPLSIDEAFLDLTGIAADLEEGRQAAQQLKDRIRTEQQLTASVGVAPNKFLAKLASDMEKPDGLVVLPLDEVPDRLWMEPVERLWGVGPKTRARLHEAGMRTVLDILKVPLTRLEQVIGSGAATHLRALARAEGVSRELRRQGYVGKTVQIKVRTGEFQTWTRAQTLPAPTDLTEVIVETARMLFRERIKLGQAGIRLLGVGVSGLEPTGTGQAALFADPEEERRRRLASAADEVREKMGPDALVRARLLKRPPGEPGNEAPDAAGADRGGGGATDEDGDDTPEASSLPSVD